MVENGDYQWNGASLGRLPWRESMGESGRIPKVNLAVPEFLSVQAACAKLLIEYALAHQDSGGRLHEGVRFSPSSTPGWMIPGQHPIWTCARL
jgi:hypothetical protein